MKLSRYLDDCEQQDRSDREYAKDCEREYEAEHEVFHCRECLGIAEHHPNCPNAPEVDDE